MPIAPAPLRELARLVLPAECPGCSAPDLLWCPGCAASFAGPPARVEAGVPRLDRLDGVAPLPVWALSRYEGTVRGVVVGWKDRGRADLDRMLAPAAARAARRLRAALAAAAGTRPRALRDAALEGAGTTSSGRDHVLPVARAVADAVGGVAAPVLQRVRGSQQVGLGARARGANVGVRADLRAVARAAASTGTHGPPVCLVIDDVVTTGATLAAAERALEQAGADVLGALVLAATPTPGDSRPRGRTSDDTPWP